MTRHSLIFGIGRYDRTNGFHPLTCPPRDAVALAKLLDDPDFVGEARQVILRLDRSFREAAQDLQDLLRSPDLKPKEDLIHIHFSGHGMRDDDGKFYLCFVDTVATELAFSGLNYEDLKHWLEVKRIQRALITLDCCYSGAAIHKDAFGAGAEVLAKVIPSEPGTAPAQAKGYCVVTATGDRELAIEGKAGVHGPEGATLSVFTHYMLEGIRTGAADGGDKGYVTAADLHRFVAHRVKSDGAAMHPQIGGKTDGDILVAHNPRVLERKRREQTAQARADFETRRAELGRQVHAWLVKHYAEDVFDAAFIAEVEGWLKGASAEMEGSPRYLLLQQAVAKRIRAVAFHQQWKDGQDGSPGPSVQGTRSPSGPPVANANPIFAGAGVRRKHADLGQRTAGRATTSPLHAASSVVRQDASGTASQNAPAIRPAISEAVAISLVACLFYAAVGGGVALLGLDLSDAVGYVLIAACGAASVATVRIVFLKRLYSRTTGSLHLSELAWTRRLLVVSATVLCVLSFWGVAFGWFETERGMIALAMLFSVSTATQLLALFVLERRSASR